MLMLARTNVRTEAMKILLVDDHQLFRSGIASLLRNQFRNLSTDEAANCREAIDHLHKDNYDVVLLDLNMPGIDGVDALYTIKESMASLPRPTTPVIIVSADDSVETVLSTFEAGSSGFIPKSESPATMVQAIELALSGQAFMPKHVIDALAVPNMPHARSDGHSHIIDGLTEREMQVVRALLRGASNKEIARQLGIEVSTVKKHLEKIYATLEVHSRVEVCAVSRKLGISWIEH